MTKQLRKTKGTEEQSKPENFDYNVRVMFRGILAGLFIAAAMLIQGCTYTRNAPLVQRNAPLIESHITANGNTVPVSAAP